MEPLTADTLALLACARGLDLTAEEIAALLPLVQATQTATAALRDASLADVEPAPSFRIV